MRSMKTQTIICYGHGYFLISWFIYKVTHIVLIYLSSSHLNTSEANVKTSRLCTDMALILEGSSWTEIHSKVVKVYKQYVLSFKTIWESMTEFEAGGWKNMNMPAL